MGVWGDKVKENEKELENLDEAVEKTSKTSISKISFRYRILIYLATAIFATASIFDSIFNCLNQAVAIALYVCAAVSLFFTCWYAVADIRYLLENVIKPKITANLFAKKVSNDYRYRTILFALPNFALNVIFALFNGVIAIMSRSGWYGCLAAYYILISVMRSSAIEYVRSSTTKNKDNVLAIRELKVYRRCGFLFVPMSMALGISVLLMVRAGSGKTYPGLLIYAVAAYTFWKISISIVNLIKAGKTKSPLLMILRNIGYADAIVSMLSLQTALLAEFSDENSKFHVRMNAVTGTAVCLMILIMGIYIIRNSRKIKNDLLSKE